jgi:RNA polymerase-binding transcription factor DksA
MTCSRCGNPIPAERVEAIPGTTVRVQCSRALLIEEAPDSWRGPRRPRNRPRNDRTLSGSGRGPSHSRA